MPVRRHRENTVILLIAGFLALNYPLLFLFDTITLIAGIPLLYLYVFICWLGIIALMAFIVERFESRANERANAKHE